MTEDWQVQREFALRVLEAAQLKEGDWVRAAHSFLPLLPPTSPTASGGARAGATAGIARRGSGIGRRLPTPALLPGRLRVCLTDGPRPAGRPGPPAVAAADRLSAHCPEPYGRATGRERGRDPRARSSRPR